jgi:uncharacterized membrane protein YidH (DUF202 family)
MGAVLIDLLPVIIGASVVPLYPIIVFLLLQSEGGLRKATAFVAGGVTIRLVQGILFGLVLGVAGGAEGQDGPGPVVATLLLLLGILLLTTAYKKWQKEEDPDAPPPQWMTSITGFSTLKAVGAGALYVVIAVKQWVFTLAAIGIIGEAGLGGSANIALYLLYTLATQLLVLIPILLFAIAPQQAAKPLAAAQAWLDRNNRVIAMTVSFIFGLWFSYKGITGLIG